MIFTAIKFAADAHTGQYRKGTNIPYICKRPANCIFSKISMQLIFAEKSYDKEREGRFNAGYDSQVA